MVQQVIDDTDQRMAGAITHYQRDLGGIRTGRANPATVENMLIDYFGTPMPLNQLAQISAADARMLVIQPWDRNAVEIISKAIQQSDLGLTPNNDGEVIRLQIPLMTEERRKEVVRMVRGKAEDARVAVRNVRKGAREEIREMEKQGEVGQDDSKRALDQLQKLTDQTVGKIDQMTSSKESEVMHV